MSTLRLNMNAFFPRRYLFLGLALVSIFIIYELQYYHYSSPTPSKATASKYTPLPRPSDGRWSWTDRKAYYPLHTFVPLPTGQPKRLPRVQYSFDATESSSERSVRLQRQAAVKTAFEKVWQSYRNNAWMKDELSPLTGGGRNTFGGWAATLVDSLDTLWIMDMKDEFYEAATAAVNIDFTTSTDEIVNVFETTIRYLGGFLAAYDLSNDMRLLHKAAEIGEMLLVPFDTPNHLPITRWNWQKAKNNERQETPDNMLVSELGSLSMEFTRLSQLTGDPRWYDAIDRITRVFEIQQSMTKLPGMWPVLVNPKKEDMTSDTGFTLGGMSDSLYEYFPKEYALLGGLEPVYQKLYEGSMSAANEHMFFRPMTPKEEDILVSGDARANGDGSSTSLEPKGQHLTCFVGGMLALGGRLFNIESHVSLGKKITDGCIWAYNATSAGVMPEIAQFVPCQSRESCPWDETRWKAAVLERAGQAAEDVNLDDLIASKHLPPGYAQIPDARYILRPEALESVFYMYRVSGDRAYPEHAWQMFSAIQHISQTDIANAAVSDITATAVSGLPPKDDRMESFWPAETLKYAYLIFSDPELISLDEYVFNTEAHPFKRPI